MSANESTSKGYGRIDDEVGQPPRLFGEIKGLFGDLKDIAEMLHQEAKEAAEGRKARRKNRVIFGSYKGKEANREAEL